MKTTRPKTPIEMAIDRQFGIVSREATIWINLSCPKCEKRQRAPAHETDPEGTSTIRIICPSCDDGDFHEPTYYDARGLELKLES